MKYENLKNALDSYWLNSETGKINAEAFCENIILVMDNTEYLYKEMLNTRRKDTAIAWQSLTETCYAICKQIHYPLLGKFAKDYVPSSAQIKKYFTEYGIDSYEFLIPVVEHVKEQRVEYNA